MAEADMLAERPRERTPGGPLKELSDRTPLRTKLITALLALVILALAAISVASVVMLHGYVTKQRDTTLRQDFPNVNPNGLALGYATPARGGGGLVIAVQKPGSQISWASASGNPGLGTSGGQGSLPALPLAVNWAVSSTPVLLTVPSQSGPDTWRVIAQTVANYQYADSAGTEVAPTATIVLAVDLGNISAMTTQLVVFDLIVGGAIVIVLAAVGAGVVRANLRPLNDIELTAGQIAAGHLDHRVPEGDPRTEIGSLGRSLNAMLAQIERAFHAQSEAERSAHQSEERMRRFIADAAHELRTPLTTIRGFAAHYRQRGGASRVRPEVPVAGGAGAGAGAGARAGGGAGGQEQDRLSRTDAAFSAPGNGSAGGSGGASGGTGSGGDTGSGAAGGGGGAGGGGAAGGGLSPEELDHLMGRVESEATRMGMLVEDLLTLARLDQQRPLTIAPVDLLSLSADAVQDARIVSPDRPISLSLAPGTAFLVDGDEARLRQVVGNLVNNALTHTPAGTPVRVKLSRGTLEPGKVGGGRPAGTPGGARADTGFDGFASGPAGAGQAGERAGEPHTVPAVVLDVEDDGPGMTADQADRVFERFYRADAARNRASGGTGLGLAIVAGLVTAHGGTVSVRTAPGQGADFQVRLPLSPDVLAADDGDDDLSA